MDVVRLKITRLCNENFYKFVIENADLEALKERIAQYPPDAIFYALGFLPESLLPWGIQHLVHHEKTRPHHLVDMITSNIHAPRGAIAELLLVAIADAHGDCGYRLPGLLYGMNKDLALQAAQRAWRRNPDGDPTKSWFSTWPESLTQREPLLALIREIPPERRPQWTRGYLLNMLAYAGARSDEIFQMVQGRE